MNGKKTRKLCVWLWILALTFTLTGCGSTPAVSTPSPDSPSTNLTEPSSAGTSATGLAAPSAGNYIVNGSFDDGEDLSPWVIDNIGGITEEIDLYTRSTDAQSGSQSLHFYSSAGVDFTAEQEIVGLPDGEYTLGCFIQGDGANASEMYIYAIVGDETFKAETGLNGYLQWNNPVIESIPVTGGSVKVGIAVKNGPGGWGTIDGFTFTAK